MVPASKTQLGGSVLIAAALLQACATAPPQTTTYDLRGPVRTAGSVMRSEMRFGFPEGNVLITFGDQTVQGRMEMRGRQVLEHELVSTDGVQPRRVKLHYAEDTLAITRVFGGKEDVETEKGPLHGLTVVGDKSAARWQFHLAEGKPSKEQSLALDELAGGFEDELWPARAVRVGESWTVDAAAAKRWLGHDLLRSTGQAKLTLRDITQHGGERCARLELHIDARGAIKDPAGNQMEISMVLEGTLYRSLATHAMVSGQLGGLMILEGSVMEEGTPVAVKISGPVTVDGRDRLQPGPSQAARAQR